MSPATQTPTRLAVTGAAGFIGSYLVRSLLPAGSDDKQNFRIYAVDELQYFGERRCARGFANQTQILSPEEFRTKFNELDLQAVFHMGACSNTEEKRADYIQKVNVEYSQALWKLCAERGIPFFYASSAGTYGLGEHGFSDDPALLPKFQPLSLYAQSKHDFDRWVLAQKVAPPKWGGFKFFNVYGPGEDHKGRQASMALHLHKQISNSSAVKLYKSYKPEFKDGEQARDFVYVGDVVKVLVDFFEKTHTSGIYNVGTGVARTFIDLAQGTAACMGKKIDIAFIEMPEALKPQYQYWTKAELARLRQAGYRERFLSLEEGLQNYFKEWEMT